MGWKSGVVVLVGAEFGAVVGVLPGEVLVGADPGSIVAPFVY